MDKKVVRQIALLLGVIVVFAITARFMASGDTLLDYAKKNPEAAYKSSENASKGSSAANEDSTSHPVISSSASSDELSSMEASTECTSAGSTSSDETFSSDSSFEERVVYMDGFYYEPIPDNIKEKIMGVSYKENNNVLLDDLRYCVLLYVDFNGETKSGEMICNKSIAQDIMEIFYELYQNGYQIQSINLVDEYGGDDHASMLANNTSCFNYREVDGTTKLSNHAYGLAIDLNPFYNPYVTYGKDGSVNISPEGSEAYADRDSEFPYKIDENDLAYKLFIAHGFKWGGNWNSCKDYQHFEKKK